jgi:tetratricopeptide (TPR) repeat protein
MRRLGTTSIVLLILFAVASPRAQDTKTDYDGEMRNGETYFHKQQYQQALRAYQHAYALTGKSSYDALVGIALAYRGLGAFKDVLDLCKDGLKLAGDDKARQAQMHNPRGAALEANASLAAARVNLGTVLLKMHRDDEGLEGFPTYIVLDGDGIVRARRIGYASDTTGWLEREIKKTLKNLQ